jgi:type IV secretory pathway VirB2 component (pilin)
VRAGWAGALLLVPRKVVGIDGHMPVPPAAVAIARVLGVRQLLQSAVTMVAPTGPVAGLSASVDALHAGTGLGFAAVSPRWRWITVVDAAIATAFAAASWSCREHTTAFRRRSG